jgi:hypothetical protein
MARRVKNFDVNEFYDDEDYYGEEYKEDDEEIAMRESKKQFDLEKKAKKKAKGV